uniref:Uncharacterized protein n=1 Tax=Micrurus paraensis TaxID=1970185 RepID=A0A2D4KJF8_9SAUR
MVPLHQYQLTATLGAKCHILTQCHLTVPAGLFAKLHFQKVCVTTNAAVGPKQNINEWELDSLIIIPSVLLLKGGGEAIYVLVQNQGPVYTARLRTYWLLVLQLHSCKDKVNTHSATS